MSVRSAPTIRPAIGSTPGSDTAGRRVLHVNKFLYRRGGAEAYMEDVAALQVAAGYRVDFFGMHHPDNEPRSLEALFPSHIELEPPPASALGKASAVGRMLWSTSAAKGMDAALDSFEPDVVHLHNIYHQLSPSVLRPLAKRGIPAVMTLHDYKLACPTYQLLDHGQVCEACLGGRFQHAVLRRCKDDSLAASVMVAAELSLHTIFGAYRPVTLFICPSHFLEAKMASANVFPDRLRWVHHFIDASVVEVKAAPGGGVVFAGRLSHEKGVDTLIKAIGLMLGEATLDIAGEGPLRGDLEALAAVVAPGRVRFHGRLSKDALYELLRASAVAAVPSRWFENQPIAILEAFASGLPIVGSNIGGIPELIDDGVDGLLAPADDPPAWARALTELLSDPDRAMAMGMSARTKIERDFRPDLHLAQIAGVYDEAVRRTAA